MLVGEFIDDALSRAWDWAEVNCAFFAADWVLVEAGVDPAARWRGRIGGRWSAKLKTAAHGGLLRVAEREMARAGFHETADPQDGDVGIVKVPTGMVGDVPVIGEVCAIRQRDFWVVRGEREVVAFPFETVKAWSVRR